MTDFIHVVDDVLSPEFCASIIRRFDANPNRHPGQTGAGLDPAKKHSIDLRLTGDPDWQDALQYMVTGLTPALADYVREHFFMLIGAISPTVNDPKTGNATELTHENFAALEEHYLDDLIHYIYRYSEIHAQKYQKGIGGYPHWHSEIYPDAAGTEALHRVLFWMYYLNDVEEGGETEFHYQSRSVTPKTGRLVIAPAGFTHTHRGNVPTSNDKYIVTSWLLFRTADQLYNRR